MRCPACKNAMSEVKVLNVSVDVCVGGCGGVWFDWYELKKVEPRHYAQGVPVLLADCEKVETHAQKACPRCEATSLQTHFSSGRRDVQVDECPNCSGFFLAHGELNAICGEATARPECAQVIAQLLDDLAAEGCEFLPKDNDLSQSREHGMARMLCLILPTRDTSRL